MAGKHDLAIRQGSTFIQDVRWETMPIVYKPITGITQTAPVSITCVGHGIPDGWRVAVVSAKGMTQINASSAPPKDKDYYAATVKTVDTLELNGVNAATYSAYISGGYLQYYLPVDLTGFTARMTIKDRVGGVILVTLTTALGNIVIDQTNKVIKLKIDAVSTAAYTWSRGVYDLELIAASGDVTTLLYGAVTVDKEITT